MNPDWDFPGAAARAAAAAAQGAGDGASGMDGGASMLDELMEFDTLLVIGLTTILLMVLQVHTSDWHFTKGSCNTLHHSARSDRHPLRHSASSSKHSSTTIVAQRHDDQTPCKP